MKLNDGTMGPKAASLPLNARALRISTLVALVALLALGPALAAQESGVSAAEIVDRMDKAMAYDECEMSLTFADTKASGATRSFEASAWYAKSLGTMIAFSSPPREKGKRILMIGDSMWMAAPSVSKPVRLSGKEAFMGTSFTNDDVMNFDKADDYEARILSSDEGGWDLELLARKRSLPYQRVLMRVGADYLPIEQSMFLLSGELAKKIEFSEPRNFGGKTRPSIIRVSDAMTSGAFTLVTFESIVQKRVDRSRLSPDRFMK